MKVNVTLERAAEKYTITACDGKNPIVIGEAHTKEEAFNEADLYVCSIQSHDCNGLPDPWWLQVSDGLAGLMRKHGLGYDVQYSYFE
jgi:hypothetical protein